MLSGLGAATADALYGILAGLGLSAVTSFLSGHAVLLQALGGLFMCCLGIRSLLKRPGQEEPGAPQVKQSLGSFFTTLLLTLSNPMTIVFFVGVFSASGMLTAGSGSGIPLLVAGVFLGSAAWWLGLTAVTALIQKKLTSQWVQRLSLFNQLSGIIMLGFGVYALIQAYSRWMA